MNQDFKDLLCAFNDRQVEYLVVGAHALAAHGHVRATKDLDLWVHPIKENAKKILAALKDFGVPPLRIDIVTEIYGVNFPEAWPERMKTKFGGVPVPVLSKKHFIKNKKAAGRTQDLADIERLEGN